MSGRFAMFAPESNTSAVIVAVAAAVIVVALSSSSSSSEPSSSLLSSLSLLFRRGRSRLARHSRPPNQRKLRLRNFRVSYGVLKMQRNSKGTVQERNSSVQ